MMKKTLFVVLSVFALGLVGCTLTPKQEYNAESRKEIISADCQSFFDGCNNCMRMEGSDEAACTLMYCEKYEKPVCLDDKELEENVEEEVVLGPNSGEEDVELLEVKYKYDADSRKTIISDDCVHFFDGCNNCNRVEGSDIAACTLMYCETYEEPTCLLEK